MTKNKEMFYWQKNADWYECDENGNVALHPDAPKRVKESFEQWKIHQERWSDESNF